MMGLFEPLALFALPLLGVIIALYLLRFRRPSAPVGSLHLWDDLTRDREANALWQRLHISGLMLLQLLVMLALIVALARPWVPSEASSGQNSIMIIDTSASMGATDGAQDRRISRLDAALEKSRSIVDDLPQGATAAIITSDEHASILVPPTEDKARLRDALARLKPQPTGTNMADAIQLASVLAQRQPNSTIWVLSDGIFPAAGGSSEPVPAQVRFFPLGSAASNQALTAISVDHRVGSLGLFVQITNADNLTVTRRLDLLVDDAPWNARTVSLGPGETQELLVDDLPIDGRVIAAHLAGVDELEIDDTAWTVNRASVPANVLMVSDGNKFLELSLALMPNVTLYKVAPADYDPGATLDGLPFDLTVLDAGVVSSTLSRLPDGNVLMFEPRASSPLFAVGDQLIAPQPSFSPLDSGGLASTEENSGRDPLLRFVDLSNLHIAHAAQITVPTWGRVVLGSDKGPLIIAGEEGGRKVGVVAFDLQQSDLPLRTAYPLLMRNLVTYLLPDPTGGVPVAVSPRSIVTIDAAEQTVNRVLVEDPSGKEWTYDLPADRRRVAYPETRQPGVYYVTQYAGDEIVAQEAFVVNLASRDESALQPNPRPGLPAGTEPTANAAPVQQGNPFRRELWPYVAVGGFMVLLLEWFVAQRVTLRRAFIEWRSRRALRRLGSQ
ncbi:MAG TPA: VWA domain-containing protein [Chloroflexia bacterium]|jgi:hypothetical protein